MTVGDGTETTATGVTGLVEALDRRARQAGTEGASNVLRGMVATITEILRGLEDRLDRIEGSVAEAGRADASEVRGSLAGLHDRIGRLEEAFVQAVESSTEGSDAMLREIRAAVDAASARPSPPPPAPPAGLAPELDRRLTEVLDRVTGVHDQLAAADEHRAAAVPDGQVLAGITNLADVVRDLEARLERAERAREDDSASRTLHDALTGVQAELARLGGRLTDTQRDDRALGAIQELRAAWEAGYDRLDRVIGAVRADLEAGPAAAGGLDPATASQVRDLEATVERLARNDSAGRLVGLIEARLSAGLDAMVGRAESAADASRLVRGAVDGATARVAEVAAAVDGLTAAVESLGARVERETTVAIEAVGGRIEERLGAVADAQIRDAATVNDSFRASLRREAELLTQRIAALASAVEAIRSSLDDHVRRTENTLGRRAGEVGRRLAVDFGLRPRPADSGVAAPARELGPGDDA